MKPFQTGRKYFGEILRGLGAAASRHLPGSDTLPPLKKMAALLSHYLGEDGQTALQKLKKVQQTPGCTVAAAWNKARPQSDEEIFSFYKNTDSYLYDLIMVHRTAERRAWRKTAIALWSKYKIRNVLDYGGGCGDDALAFSRAGMRCALYDCSTLLTGFAQCRARHEGLALETLRDLPADRQFDGIYCTELLEHLADPFGELEKMQRHLAPQGILLVTHSFDLIGEKYPSHLARHKGLSGTFVPRMEGMGFACEETVGVPGNRFYVFRKAGQPAIVPSQVPAGKESTVPAPLPLR